MSELRFESDERRDFAGWTKFNEWSSPNHDRRVVFYRKSDRYLVRFNDIADFEIHAGQTEVLCWPLNDDAQSMCRDLFLNQVRPLLDAASGRLVVHASGVVLANRAALFMGPSGMGKSTLATFLARRGDPLLSDDGITVDDRDDGLWTLPSKPHRVRLWHDSASALFGQTPNEQSAKMSFDGPNGLAFATTPAPLGAIFALEKGNDLSILRLNGREALFAVHTNLFILDDRDDIVKTAHFRSLTRVASAIPVYRLRLPQTFEALAAAREQILEAVRSTY